MNVSISMHRKKSSMLRNYKHYHHLYLYKQNVQSLDHYLTAKNPEKIYNKDGKYFLFQQVTLWPTSEQESITQ